MSGIALLELFTDGDAVERQATIVGPVVAESEAEPVAGLGIVGAVGVARGGNLPERRLASGSSACNQFIPPETRQHVIACRSGAWMPLEAGLFEKLRGNAVARELSSQRIPERSQLVDHVWQGATVQTIISHRCPWTLGASMLTCRHIVPLVPHVAIDIIPADRNPASSMLASP